MATVTIRIRARDESDTAFANARRNAKLLQTALLSLGPSIVPIGAAATVALGKVASSMAGAAVAAGAFGAAVIPQVQAIKDADAAYQNYNKAVAEFGKNSEEAKTALQAYKAQLEQMPPATRETAKAFSGLKDDFKKWSDSLAGDTMPVFTKGLEILRKILPMLTPLVKGAAKVFNDLMDRLGKKVDSKGFESFMKKMTDWALNGLKKTIDGVITLSQKIAGFVTSQGFKDFIDYGAKYGPQVVEVLKNLAEFVGKFVVAAGPIAGISFKALQILAEVLNALPMDVLEVLVPTIAAVVLGLKLWAIANTVYAAAQWLVNAAIMGFPLTWIIGAIVAVIAIIVLIATKTTWFQTAWKYAWNAIKAVTSAVWNFLRDRIFRPLATFFTQTLPNAAKALWRGIQSAFNSIRSAIGSAANWIRDKMNTLWNWLRGLPGKLRSAFSGVASALSAPFRAAFNAIRSAWNSTVGGKGFTVPSWVPGLGGKGFRIPRFATGGITSGGLSMVGERGRELVNLPAGSHVKSNPDSERMLRSGGSAGQPMVVNLVVDGKVLASAVVDPLRKDIRNNGGNVQAYLGR